MARQKSWTQTLSDIQIYIRLENTNSTCLICTIISTKGALSIAPPGNFLPIPNPIPTTYMISYILRCDIYLRRHYYEFKIYLKSKEFTQVLDLPEKVKVFCKILDLDFHHLSRYYLTD